jgi:DNA-binding ferritin-like protein
MTSEAEVERYVKDPGLLVELCRDVVERLDAGADTGETSAMEAQLREIARAIDKLCKMGVPVPEALRAEKTRLAVALGVNAEAAQTLSHLADDLEALLNDLKTRIARAPETTPGKKTRAKRSKSQKTDKTVLRRLIIEALRHLGGSAPKNDVLQYMEQTLQDKLLPGDLEWRESSNEYAWQNNACWERYAMTQDGALKIGSKRGVWELSEDIR